VNPNGELKNGSQPQSHEPNKAKAKVPYGWSNNKLPSWETCGWECGANKAQAGRSGCTVTCHISHMLRHIITTRPPKSEPRVVGYELLQPFWLP